MPKVRHWCWEHQLKFEITTDDESRQIIKSNNGRTINMETNWNEQRIEVRSKQLHTDQAWMLVKACMVHEFQNNIIEPAQINHYGQFMICTCRSNRPAWATNGSHWSPNAPCVNLDEHQCCYTVCFLLFLEIALFGLGLVWFGSVSFQNQSFYSAGSTCYPFRFLWSLLVSLLMEQNKTWSGFWAKTKLATGCRNGNENRSRTAMRTKQTIHKAKPDDRQLQLSGIPACLVM